MKLWNAVYSLSRLIADAIADERRWFIAWAADLDKRSRSGEFGKWPWQEQYGLWPWQRRRPR